VNTLSTPFKKEDLAALAAGDIFYISGTIVTGRDAVHERVVLRGQKLPLDLRGLGIYHAGPIMRKGAGGVYETLAAGPTTSMRMEELQGEFLAATGASLIIGKGGMGPKTAAACVLRGAVHAVYPGGCAVLAARCVEKAEGPAWPELGMAEAIWVLRVRDFGPLIVSIDTRGENLFENNGKIFAQRKELELAALRNPGAAGPKR
jgi:L(+)-tartrate dehydratase beta subunit